MVCMYSSLFWGGVYDGWRDVWGNRADYRGVSGWEYFFRFFGARIIVGRSDSI